MLVTCIPAAERQRSNRSYQLDAKSSELVSVCSFYHTSLLYDRSFVEGFRGKVFGGTVPRETKL